MFLACKVIFLLGIIFCYSEIVFFGQNGDFLGEKVYFWLKKLVFCPKNVFLHPLANSGAIIFKMIS